MMKEKIIEEFHFLGQIQPKGNKWRWEVLMTDNLDIIMCSDIVQTREKAIKKVTEQTELLDKWSGNEIKAIEEVESKTGNFYIIKK